MFVMLLSNSVLGSESWCLDVGSQTQMIVGNWSLCSFKMLFYLLCRKFDKFTAELHPISVKPDVWDMIGVDLIGPLPVTPRGNKFIITVSCYFSKWPEAAALPDKTAEGVAEFLFKCFTRHGCCKVKITDQGREFVNQVNRLFERYFLPMPTSGELGCIS